jgi:ubiquinone/menaquinone biosynthesis C-methylase UbiE
MMNRMITRQRQIFGRLHGRILEIGTGTGANLTYYARDSEVIATDWSENMVKVAKSKVKGLQLTQIKKIVVADAQQLSHLFPPQSFDFITSTCVFCSIPEPLQALREIKTILKPSGKLVQIEHGLSRIALLNWGMRVFDPLFVKLNGAHITRNHQHNLKRAGYQIIRSHRIDPLGIMQIIISQP